MTNEDMAVKIAEVEHRSTSNTRRIEKLELQTEAIQKLATSVEVVVTELRHQTDSVQRIEKSVTSLDSKLDTKVGELDERLDTEVSGLDKRLEDIEKKPAKKWDNLVEKVVLAIVGAVIGLALAQIGLA